MNLKKLSFLIMLLSISLMFAKNTNAIFYNENYTNIALDNNGWCAGLEITFNVMNETDYQNKKTIEDNLCGVNETPEDDDCEEFHILKDFPVKVYNGPLEDLPLILDAKTDANGEFKIIFNEPNQYLINIEHKGNYNDYSKIYFVDECKNAQIQQEIEESINEDNQIVLYNQTFEYKDKGLEVELKNTDMSSAQDISIFNTNPGEFEIAPLNNTLNAIIIKAKTQNYTNLKLNFDVQLPENSDPLLFKYDITKKSWMPITNFKYENSTKKIVLENAQLGIYATAFNKKEEIITNQSTTQTELDNPTNQEKEEITTETSNIKNTKSFGGFIFLGLLILLIIGIFYFFFTNDRSSTRHKASENKEEFRVQKNKPVKELEILDTYSQVYQRTKQYIQTYKDSYTKDQIYRALLKAQIPTDIINKLFDEMY